jgi:hypothetical protein
MFVRLRALNAEIAHSLFFHWINLYWVAGRDHIRKRQAISKSLWRDFESLYKEVLAIERKKDPASKDIELLDAKGCPVSACSWEMWGSRKARPPFWLVPEREFEEKKATREGARLQSCRKGHSEFGLQPLRTRPESPGRQLGQPHN